MREDGGKYTIVATNDYGRDSADIEVIVVDKPGPPTGPIQYTSTTQESVALAWNPPHDNGGSDVTNYIVEVADFGTENWHQVILLYYNIYRKGVDISAVMIFFSF